jgi:hypothetical protein
MVRYLLISFLLITALGFSQEAVFNPKYPIAKFPKVKEGRIVNYVYEFTNSGDAPLEFYSYEVECTCTKVELPINPTQPGQKGRISVSFDTHGKSYYQDRIIYLQTNTERKKEKLRLKVYVDPKKVENSKQKKDKTRFILF